MSTDPSTAGWARLHLDTAGVHDKAQLMDRLALALDLPPWFGRNWDALADCLTEVGHDPGTVLEWTGADDLPVELSGPLREILEERADEGSTPFRVMRTD